MIHTKQMDLDYPELKVAFVYFISSPPGTVKSLPVKSQ